MYKLLILILTISLFTACRENTVNIPDNTEHPQPLEAMQKSNRDFALRLFKESVAQTEIEKNVMLSPASVSIAISMALTGSAGQTREEIIETLGYEGLSMDQVHNTNKYLIDKLVRSDTSIRLDLANAIFWDPSMVQPFDLFISTNAENYNAELSELNFNDPSAISIINDWVKAQTEERIEKIIENIAPEEIMFLINALYLKANWQSSFNEELNFDNAFTLNNQETIQTTYMNQRGDFRYLNTESYTAVDLLFSDSTMSMTFVMPQQDANLSDWINDWTAEGLDAMYDLLQPSDIRLIIPKFELGFHIDLKQALSKMGMALAFDQYNADFSRLGTSFGNIFLSRVEHKTYINVDEYGVEGAAVTAVGVGTTSAPPTIHFNRPFVFIIRDVPTETVLFIAKVVNPEEEVE